MKSYTNNVIAQHVLPKKPVPLYEKPIRQSNRFDVLNKDNDDDANEVEENKLDNSILANL